MLLLKGATEGKGERVRSLLHRMKERTRGAALLLSIVATMLALLSLALAAYAVYHILSTRQDMWLSYSAAEPGIALAPVLAVVGAAAVLLALTRAFWRSRV